MLSAAATAEEFVCAFTLSTLFAEPPVHLEVQIVVDSGCMRDLALQPGDIAALGLREVQGGGQCFLANGSQSTCKIYEQVKVSLKMSDGSIAEAVLVPIVLNCATEASSSAPSFENMPVTESPAPEISEHPCAQEATSSPGISSILLESAGFALASPDKRQKVGIPISEAHASLTTRDSPPGSPPAAVAIISGSGERLIGYSALARLGLLLDPKHGVLLRRMHHLRF